MFWKPEVNLLVITASKNYIDTLIKYEGKEFYATFIYVDTDSTKRKQTWDELTSLSTIINSPWIFFGDFNDITGNLEKDGGRTRPEGSFIDFRTFLSACDMFDLPDSGDFLSWREIRGDQVVRCILDRTIANSHWFYIFYAGRCEYLKYEAYDHKPIVTCFDATRKKKQGLFRFDRRLKDKPEVKDLIEKTWKESAGSAVEQKITLVRRALVKWCKDQHINSRKEIDQKKVDLEKAMTSRENNVDLINKINGELKKAYLEEEALWLRLGDKNSGFFHAVTKGRHAINSLTS